MRESRWQQFDFVIVACVLGLILAGVAMIHSATCGSPCSGLLPPEQLRAAPGALGGGRLRAAGRRQPDRLPLVSRLRLPPVRLRGGAAGPGAAHRPRRRRRRLRLASAGSTSGVFDLQASEVAKLAVLVVLARVLGEKPEGPLSFRRLMASLAMVLVPIGLVFVEPDLGTSLSFLMIWVTMVAGRRHPLAARAAAVRRRPGRHAAGLAGHEGLHARAPGHVHGHAGRPRARRLRRGLQRAAGAHQHRLGRPVRARLPGGHPEPARLPAHHPVRLHLLGRRRGARASSARRCCSACSSCCCSA